MVNHHIKRYGLPSILLFTICTSIALSRSAAIEARLQRVFRGQHSSAASVLNKASSDARHAAAQSSKSTAPDLPIKERETQQNIFSAKDNLGIEQDIILVKMHAGHRRNPTETQRSLHDVLQKKDITLQTIEPLLPSGATASTKRKDSRSAIDQWNILTVDASKHSDQSAILAAIEDLKKHPTVLEAQPSYIYEPFVIPNDTYFLSQGSWGQGYRDLWGLESIGMEQAWEYSTGEGVVVAVVDTGVDYTHRDIAENIWSNTDEFEGDNNADGCPGVCGLDDDNDGLIDEDFYGCTPQGVNADNMPCQWDSAYANDDDENGYIDDTRGWDFFYDAQQFPVGTTDPMDWFIGHGTHVAGTIAATGDNNEGIVGVAPDAEIMPLAGLISNNATISLSRALLYAADNGASIINNSWGSSIPSGADSVMEDVVRSLIADDVLVVFAAGNDSSNVLSYSPNSMKEVLTVAATDEHDQKAFFSNFGKRIDVSAPGGSNDQLLGPNILSLNARDGNVEMAIERPENIVDEQYLRAHGTSMAAPHVAGAAAILRSYFPNETEAQIRGRIIASTQPIDNLNPNYIGEVGAGRLDVVAAIEREPQLFLRLTDSQQQFESDGSILLQLDLQNVGIEADAVSIELVSENPLVIEIPEHTVQLHTVAAHSILPTTSFRVVPTELAKPGDYQPLRLLVKEGGILLQEIPIQFSVAQFDTVEIGEDVYFAFGVTAADLDKNTVDNVLVGTTTPSGERAVRKYTIESNDVFSYTEIDALSQGVFYPRVVFDVDKDGDMDIMELHNSTLTLQENIAPDVYESIVLPQFSLDSSGYLQPTDFDNDNDIDILYIAIDGRYLLRNDSLNIDGRAVVQFVDVTDDVSFSDATGYGHFVDYDNDGDDDYFDAEGKVFQNIEGIFSDVTAQVLPDTHTCDAIQTIFSGNYDNDTDEDLALSYGERCPFEERFQLLENRDGIFVDVTQESGVHSKGFHLSPSGFVDMNNDGWLDLLLISGQLSSQLEVFINNGDGTFSNNTAGSGLLGSNGFEFIWSAAGRDFDNDGDIDIFGSQIFGGIYYQKNLQQELDAKSFVQLRLHPSQSNSISLGAVVTITTDQRTITRKIYANAFQHNTLHTGLYTDEQILHVEVRWPSGQRTTLEGMESNTVHDIREPPQLSFHPNQPAEITIYAHQENTIPLFGHYPNTPERRELVYSMRLYSERFDVNGDQLFDPYDVAFLQAHLGTADLETFDLDNNGKVDEADVQLLELQLHAHTIKGIHLDELTGNIQWRPITTGVYNFTVTYTLSLGASIQHVSIPLQITVSENSLQFSEDQIFNYQGYAHVPIEGRLHGIDNQNDDLMYNIVLYNPRLDFNADGMTGFQDLSLLEDAIATQNNPPQYDLTQDGVVDHLDHEAFTTAFEERADGFTLQEQTGEFSWTSTGEHVGETVFTAIVYKNTPALLFSEHPLHITVEDNLPLFSEETEDSIAIAANGRINQFFRTTTEGNLPTQYSARLYDETLDVTDDGLFDRGDMLLVESALGLQLGDDGFDTRFDRNNDSAVTQDDIDVFYAAFEHLPSFGSTQNTSNGIALLFTPNEPDAGAYSFTITAELIGFPNEYTSIPLELTVVLIPRSPVSLVNLTATEHESFSYQLDVSHADTPIIYGLTLYDETYDIDENGYLDPNDLGLIDELIEGGWNDPNADLDNNGVINQQDRQLLEQALQRLPEGMTVNEETGLVEWNVPRGAENVVLSAYAYTNELPYLFYPYTVTIDVVHPLNVERQPTHNIPDRILLDAPLR